MVSRQMHSLSSFRTAVVRQTYSLNSVLRMGMLRRAFRRYCSTRDLNQYWSFLAYALLDGLLQNIVCNRTTRVLSGSPASVRPRRALAAAIFQRFIDPHSPQSLDLPHDVVERCLQGLQQPSVHTYTDAVAHAVQILAEPFREWRRTAGGCHSAAMYATSSLRVVPDTMAQYTTAPSRPVVDPDVVWFAPQAVLTGCLEAVARDASTLYRSRGSTGVRGAFQTNRLAERDDESEDDDEDEDITSDALTSPVAQAFMVYEATPAQLPVACRRGGKAHGSVQGAGKEAGRGVGDLIAWCIVDERCWLRMWGWSDVLGGCAPQSPQRQCDQDTFVDVLLGTYEVLPTLYGSPARSKRRNQRSTTPRASVISDPDPTTSTPTSEPGGSTKMRTGPSRRASALGGWMAGLGARLGKGGVDDSDDKRTLNPLRNSTPEDVVAVVGGPASCASAADGVKLFRQCSTEGLKAAAGQAWSELNLFASYALALHASSESTSADAQALNVMQVTSAERSLVPQVPFPACIHRLGYAHSLGRYSTGHIPFWSRIFPATLSPGWESASRLPVRQVHNTMMCDAFVLPRLALLSLYLERVACGVLQASSQLKVTSPKPHLPRAQDMPALATGAAKVCFAVLDTGAAVNTWCNGLDNGVSDCLLSLGGATAAAVTTCVKATVNVHVCDRPMLSASKGATGTLALPWLAASVSLNGRPVADTTYSGDGARRKRLGRRSRPNVLHLRPTCSADGVVTPVAVSMQRAQAVLPNKLLWAPAHAVNIIFDWGILVLVPQSADEQQYWVRWCDSAIDHTSESESLWASDLFKRGRVNKGWRWRHVEVTREGLVRTGGLRVGICERRSVGGVWAAGITLPLPSIPTACTIQRGCGTRTFDCHRPHNPSFACE